MEEKINKNNSEWLKKNIINIIGGTGCVFAVIVVLLYIYFNIVRTAKLDSYEGISDISIIYPIFWIFASVICVCTGIIFYFIFIKKYSIEKIAVVLGFTLGILYMVVLPPESAPDENRHIDTVYYYSGIILGQETLDTSGNVMVRSQDIYFSTADVFPAIRSYYYIFEHLFETYPEEQMIENPIDAKEPLNTTAIGYIPQLVGVVIARTFNFSQPGLLLAGRLTGLIFYVICIYYAVKKMPFMKNMLMFIALLPISLQQATSFSHDAVINSMSFLFVAYALNLIYEGEKIKTKDIIILIVSGGVLTICKPVYVFLCLLCLLIPFNKKVDKKDGIKKVLLIIAGIGLITLIANYTKVIGISSGENVSADGVKIIEWLNEPGYTLGDIISNPIHMIKLFFMSFILSGPFYVRSMVGGVLGWLEIGVPYVVSFGFIIILILASIRKKDETMEVSGRLAGTNVLIIVMCIGSIFFAMLLSWTSVNSKCIEGIQGRYFLPILPLGLMLLNNKKITIKYNIDTLLNIGYVFFQLMTILKVFSVVIGR